MTFFPGSLILRFFCTFFFLLDSPPLEDLVITFWTCFLFALIRFFISPLILSLAFFMIVKDCCDFVRSVLQRFLGCFAKLLVRFICFYGCWSFFWLFNDWFVSKIVLVVWLRFCCYCSLFLCYIFFSYYFFYPNPTFFTSVLGAQHFFKNGHPNKKFGWKQFLRIAT